MSYNVGPYKLKRGLDFVGRRVIFLSEMKTRRGEVFAEGSVAWVRSVWKGKFNLVQDIDTYRKCIGPVSGWEVRLLPLETKPDCRCAGPEYDPDKPCPVHPKVTR